MPDTAVVYLMNAIFSSKSKLYESTTRAETKDLFTATDEVWWCLSCMKTYIHKTTRYKNVHVVVARVWLSVAVTSMLQCVTVASVLWYDAVCCSSECAAVWYSSLLWRLYLPQGLRRKTSSLPLSSENTSQIISCLILYNIWSFLHNIWQCYNPSTTYCKYSTTLVCCIIITQHIHNSYTTY